MTRESKRTPAITESDCRTGNRPSRPRRHLPTLPAELRLSLPAGPECDDLSVRRDSDRASGSSKGTWGVVFGLSAVEKGVNAGGCSGFRLTHPCGRSAGPHVGPARRWELQPGGGRGCGGGGGRGRVSQQLPGPGPQPDPHSLSACSEGKGCLLNRFLRKSQNPLPLPNKVPLVMWTPWGRPVAAHGPPLAAFTA